VVDAASIEGFSSCENDVQLEQRRDPVGGSSVVHSVPEVTAPADENNVPANG